MIKKFNPSQIKKTEDLKERKKNFNIKFVKCYITYN